MTVFGTGRANGGISILHAAGLGKGCSVGLQLETQVSLVEGPAFAPQDEHRVLDSVLAVWGEFGYPTPDGTGWRVETEVPVGQGLKSSAALACAAARALNEASWTGLSDPQIVDIAVAAQRRSGCTLTGSMDDAWAAISPGWKLVDPEQASHDSILLEGDIETGLSVLIALRGPRDGRVEPEAFANQSKLFERALASLSSGSIFSAMSANGMAVAAATAGDTRWVRPPRPCRPSKLRLLVLAQRSPAESLSGFMAKHIEQPGSRQSNPAATNTSWRPSASAWAFTEIGRAHV